MRFANGAVKFDRIRAGDRIWRTHDPEIDKAARPFLDPAAPVAKQLLAIRVIAGEGAPLEAEWWLVKRPELSVIVKSAAPLERAQNRGLSAESLREQFGRLGNTAYELADLSTEIKGSPFAPASVLNQMRRDAVEKLQELQAATPAIEIHPFKFKSSARESSKAGEPQLHLLVRTPEQLNAAIEMRPASITLDYLDLYGLRPSVERVKSSGIAARVASPRVLKPGEEKIVQFLASLDCAIIVRAAGMIDELSGKSSNELIGDFSLNAANSIATASYLDLGLARITASHDLNADQIAALARQSGADRIEAIAYQHLPVFHTEHCVFCRFLSTGTSYRDCGRPCEKHRVELKDPSGRAHPVLADVGCRNTVFGAEAQEASAHLDAWLDAGIRHFRLEFAHESADEVSEVVRAFQATLRREITSATLASKLKRIAPQGTTEGSLFVPKDYLTLPILQ